MQPRTFNAIILQGSSMRITVVLDDELVRTAQDLIGIAEATALLRQALQALIERESARKLAALGGTMPGLKNIPRRKTRRAPS
jgi:hypothetical protein